MKSLDELRAVREKARAEMNLEGEPGNDNIRVVIGMATCGIAAGAKSVMDAFLYEVSKRNLENVKVTQTGCIGVCRLEPIVEVYMPGEKKITYVIMTPGKVQLIVNNHLVNRQVVNEYTIGAVD